MHPFYYVRTSFSVMAHLSEALKLKILVTHARTGCVNQTAHECRVSKPTALRWLNRFKLAGSVKEKKSTGRKPTVTPVAAAAAVHLFESDLWISADQVARLLFERGLCDRIVHRTTLVRHAKDAAKRAGLVLWLDRSWPKQALTPATQKRRLAFARANKLTSWDHVMFTDRVRITLDYPGTKVKQVVWRVTRRIGAPKRVVFKPNKPACVNVYGGITKFGTTFLYVVAGTTGYKSPYKNKKGIEAKNITASEYEHVLTHCLLPQGQKLFSSYGMHTWQLMQDNDPAHFKAPKIVTAWAKANKVNVRVLLNWPPHSPDLNPIENVWGWMKAKVNEKGCKDFPEFVSFLNKLFHSIPKRMLNNYFRSMRNRIKAVEESKGGKTNY